MQITFDRENNQNKVVTEGLQARTAAAGRQTMGKSSALGAAYKVGEGNSLFVDSADKKKKQSPMDVVSEEDFKTKQDFMTLMSNTLSDEDYKKLQEDGFHPTDMEPGETVTIVDKIKAELVKSGKHIEGYTDDVNMEALCEAVGGSEAFARALAEDMAAADLPLYEETIDEIGKAYAMVQAIGTPGDGSFRYLIDNELEPEIQTMYLAKSSGADVAVPANAGYYSAEIGGYFTKAGGPLENPDKEMARVFEAEGKEFDESAKKATDWLVRENLPLTIENVLKAGDLLAMEFPVQADTFANAVTEALALGKPAAEGNLLAKQTIYQKANAILERYISVEEVRLEMTAQLNVALLKSGFSFETASIEETLQALRDAKEQIAKELFPGQAGAVEQYDLFEATNRIVADIPMLPEAVMTQQMVAAVGQISIEEFHASGEILKGQYAEASKEYETLMTAPRSDMGDSIRKAFRNVDAILEDLKLDVTKENRQAVRILGYNQMEITTDNLKLVEDACNQVKEVVNKMTPASVLSMIRDGVNPLEQSFDELNVYFDSREEDYEQEVESYSRFLYRLEQQNDVTPEEKESYIGVFRLLHQIEKGDMQAVGALVNYQAELNFSNLLSAGRTNRAKHMDVSVEQSFGALEKMVKKDAAIDEQIEKAFRQEQRQAFLEGKQAQEEVFLLAEKAEIPTSAANLAALKALMEDRTLPFGPLSKKKDLEQALESKEEFEKEYDALLEESGEEARDSSWKADSYMEVKQLQLVNKQLSILGALRDKEEYVFPTEIDGETVRVHLTIEHRDENKGSVTIQIPVNETEQVEATLSLTENKVSGYLVGNTENEVMISGRIADIFSEQIKEDSSFGMDAKPVVTDRANTKAAVRQTGRDKETKRTQVTNNALYRVAKLFIHAAREALSQ